MKINILSSALAAIVGLALISVPANAQTTPAATTTAPAAPAAPVADDATKTKPKAGKSDYTEYEGTVSAIDATSVTVTTKKGDVKLTLDATTKYKVGKKKAAATDFAVGDKVTGSYKAGDDGSMTAHSLHKKAAK